MKNSRLFAPIVFAVLLALSPFSASAQCSMCTATARNGVESADNPKAKGLNDGILLLMSVPYAAAAVVGVLWYRRSKSAKARV